MRKEYLIVRYWLDNRGNVKDTEYVATFYNKQDAFDYLDWIEPENSRLVRYEIFEQ